MSTITYVGAGTTATAVNASVTPVAHASTTTGDLVIVAASIRNSGTGTVVLPADWTSLVDFGNVRVMAKIWDGVAIPAITFAGGAANADCIGETATYRGVSREALVAVAASATQLNGSAANIAYPGLTVARDRHLALLVAWKQDDATAVSTPATMTATVSALNVIAGDDAFQSVHHVIQTTAANIASGTLTMTGGAAAISRVVLLALKPAATFTATEQATYPPRVLLTLADLTIGDDVALYRVVGGVRTAVRAGTAVDVTDPSFLVLDAEIPFGVPVSYVATVNGVEYTTSPVTYTLPGGKVALSDAITGLAAEVVVSAWPSQSYDPRSSVFRVAGRNIVVSTPTSMWTGSLELYVEATSSVENLRALIANATEGILQIRQPGGYDGVDAYFVAVGVAIRRYSQDGSDERRIIALDAVEVEGWAPALEAQGFTYADLEAAYTGLTYADLAGDYATYLLLAQATF